MGNAHQLLTQGAWAGEDKSHKLCLAGRAGLVENLLELDSDCVLADPHFVCDVSYALANGGEHGDSRFGCGQTIQALQNLRLRGLRLSFQAK